MAALFLCSAATNIQRMRNHGHMTALTRRKKITFGEMRGVVPSRSNSRQSKVKSRVRPAAFPFHRLAPERRIIPAFVFTLVRTVPPHIDKPTGFPSVKGEGNDIGGWRAQKRAPRE
jgi:hypothetical protein